MTDEIKLYESLLDRNEKIYNKGKKQWYIAVGFLCTIDISFLFYIYVKKAPWVDTLNSTPDDTKLRN